MSYYDDKNEGYQRGNAPGYGYSQQQSQQPQYQHQQYQQPPQQQQYQQPPQQGHDEGSESGNYQGLSYTVKHRNTSSILNIRLNQGDQVKSLPGTMVHMSPTVQLQGKIKVSMKKLFTGAQLDESTYTGPGTVALAPVLMGDIITLQVQPGKTWKVGKEWYLARTMGVEMETHAQKLGQALFSGDGLFVYHMTGSGLLWLYAYGALDTIHLQPGEQHIVENGHLVAWDCEYHMEKAGSGGVFNMLKTQEGIVCRLTGPGTVHYSTRNLSNFQNWISEQSSSN